MSVFKCVTLVRNSVASCSSSSSNNLYYHYFLVHFLLVLDIGDLLSVLQTRFPDFSTKY